jgi:hypothetical protein
VIAVTEVWLEYPETGGKAQFNEEAAHIWRQRGWVDTDPPPEPDLTKDPAPEDDGGVSSSGASKATNDTGADEPMASEDVAENGEQGQDKSSRSSRRKRDSATEE